MAESGTSSFLRGLASGLQSTIQRMQQAQQIGQGQDRLSLSRQQVQQGEQRLGLLGQRVENQAERLAIQQQQQEAQIKNDEFIRSLLGGQQTGFTQQPTTPTQFAPQPTPQTFRKPRAKKGPSQQKQNRAQETGPQTFSFDDKDLNLSPQGETNEVIRMLTERPELIDSIQNPEVREQVRQDIATLGKNFDQQQRAQASDRLGRNVQFTGEAVTKGIDRQLQRAGALSGQQQEGQTEAGPIKLPIGKTRKPENLFPGATDQTNQNEDANIEDEMLLRQDNAQAELSSLLQQLNQARNRPDRSVTLQGLNTSLTTDVQPKINDETAFNQVLQWAKGKRVSAANLYNMLQHSTIRTTEPAQKFFEKAFADEVNFLTQNMVKEVQNQEGKAEGDKSLLSKNQRNRIQENALRAVSLKYNGFVSDEFKDVLKRAPQIADMGVQVNGIIRGWGFNPNDPNLPEMVTKMAISAAQQMKINIQAAHGIESAKQQNENYLNEIIPPSESAYYVALDNQGKRIPIPAGTTRRQLLGGKVQLNGSEVPVNVFSLSPVQQREAETAQSFDQGIQTLGNIVNELFDADQGLFSRARQMSDQVKSNLFQTDPNAVLFFRLKPVLSRLIARQVEKGTMTEGDVQAFFDLYPSPSDTREVAQAKVLTLDRLFGPRIKNPLEEFMQGGQVVQPPPQEQTPEQGPANLTPQETETFKLLQQQEEELRRELQRRQNAGTNNK